MPTRRRAFKRPPGKRRYKKLFVVATEGSKTEPQYFNILNNDNSVICIKCLKSKHDSSPPQVLERMNKHLAKESLKKTDEAWLVVDKDNWSNSQLQELFNWSAESENRGFALSNPNFEYWLLLHFELGNGVTNPGDCSARLKQYLPNYNKNIQPNRFLAENIERAITNAKLRNNPPCEDWPREFGKTTVYLLVEKILQVE